MADRAFVDTNILLYSISLRPGEERKQAVAQDLLDADGDYVISMQVLHEFYSQATQSRKAGAIPTDHAWRLIESWKRFDIQENTMPVLEAAHALKARTGYSIWDCLILAAARAQGCTIVYSEDMQHGRIVNGLRIVNPFEAGASS